MKQLTLVVSVLESYEVVRRQLLHLQRLLTPTCELILVDDGSEPSLQSTCDAVHKDFAFTLIFTHDHRPWTQPKGRNIGARAAQADKLLFFDIDHIITQDILQQCLVCEADKLHWIRHPGILDMDGQIVTDWGVMRDHGLTDTSLSVHGNSFMIRKELFHRLGGYDERYCGQYGGDDIDFNERFQALCRAGLAIPEQVRGEGYVFPDPARDAKGLFHTLPRTCDSR